jgi:hypothetical protein
MKKEIILPISEAEQLKEAIWSVLETYSPTSKCQYKSVYELANFAGISMNKLDLYALPDSDLRELIHDGHDELRYEYNYRGLYAPYNYGDYLV